MNSQKMHPAENFNRIRRILFSTIHDRTKGFEVAENYLDTTYKKQLQPNEYAGLRAEIDFYKQFRKKYSLTPSADTGEHSDFAGVIGGKGVRFDVTTNISHKEYKTFEPFLCEGHDYKIALYDQNSFQLIDVLELAFPRCNRCGDSYKFPYLLLLKDNVDSDGMTRWTNDQILLDICPACRSFEEKSRYSHSGLRPVTQHISYHDYDDDDEYSKDYEQYANIVFDYARVLTAKNVMGIAENSYNITERDGGGDWVIWFPMQSPIAEQHMPDLIISGIID